MVQQLNGSVPNLDFLFNVTGIWLGYLQHLRSTVTSISRIQYNVKEFAWRIMHLSTFTAIAFAKNMTQNGKRTVTCSHSGI